MPPLFMEEDIMLEINLGGKPYQIKYAYTPVVKSGILKKLAQMSDGDNGLDSIDKIMNILPELILVGLQKNHKKEFGYVYDTNAGKEEKLSKVYDALDDYFDGENADFMELFQSLQNELLENSFLSKMFREAQEETKNEQKVPEEQKN